MTQTITLRGHTRPLAHHIIQNAPDGYVLRVSEPGRTLDQNAKLWACLSDVSRAKPEGRTHTPEVWKALFMQAAGWQIQFVEGLDGTPFPVGFRSSRMTKREMSYLLEFVREYGDRHGVQWTEPEA
jgi:hypothetical protein